MNDKNISTYAAWGLQLTKEKRDAAFFMEIRDDTYICSIFKGKILHPAFHELYGLQPFVGTLPRMQKCSISLSFVCRRFAPLELMNTLFRFIVETKEKQYGNI